MKIRKKSLSSPKSKVKFKGVKPSKRAEQEVFPRLIEGKYICIDPGIQGAGWCIGDYNNWHKKCLPVATGCISPPGSWSFENRCLHVCEEMIKIKKEYGVRAVFMEYPQYMQSAKGDVAARSGKLVKLCIIYGMIAGVLGSIGECDLHPVSIPKWKGQLKDDKVIARVEKKLPKLNPVTHTTHEYDAIGIYLYVKGFFGET